MKEIARKDRNQQLINELLKVWESSVRTTHTFLSNDEILEIKGYVPETLRSIAHLVIETNQNNDPIAFMGIGDDKLEMLFVAPEYRSSGIGRKMLTSGINNYGVTELAVNELAVNEDNPQARGFYEHMGFVACRRNELDDQGRPYPVLYMRLNN